MILKPVIIDNWYTKKELKKVYKELDFYTDRDKLITQHGNVATHEGRDQADCFRVNLDSYYTPIGRKLSDIIMLMSKMRQKESWLSKYCNR